MNKKNQEIDLTTDSIPKLLRQLFIPARLSSTRLKEKVLLDLRKSLSVFY